MGKFSPLCISSEKLYWLRVFLNVCFTIYLSSFFQNFKIPKPFFLLNYSFLVFGLLYETAIFHIHFLYLLSEELLLKYGLVIICFIFSFISFAGLLDYYFLDNYYYPLEFFTSALVDSFSLEF